MIGDEEILPPCVSADKESCLSLHFLCRVKQTAPPAAPATDCGTRFNLRSMCVLLKQRASLRMPLGLPPRARRHGGGAGSGLVRGELAFHEKADT